MEPSIVPDAVFEHPRLIAIYDALEPERRDLDAYLDLVTELGAHRVLDVGCGTGVFALLLAQRGRQVVGVDPAGGSLAVARGKPGADQVRWIHGDATNLPPLQLDLATMTGNVAQAIAEPSTWRATLRGVFAALRPGGTLVFETRDPAARAWEHWTPAATRSTTFVPGVGRVENWTEVTGVRWPLVTFRTTWLFATDGASLTSTSTLRFRDQDEVSSDLREAGYVVDDVRAAPDRPGLEFVFLARRPCR